MLERMLAPNVRCNKDTYLQDSLYPFYLKCRSLADSRYKNIDIKEMCV